jgi:hypothetical protein
MIHPDHDISMGRIRRTDCQRPTTFAQNDKRTGGIEAQPDNMRRIDARQGYGLTDNVADRDPDFCARLLDHRTGIPKKGDISLGNGKHVSIEIEETRTSASCSNIDANDVSLRRVVQIVVPAHGLSPLLPRLIFGRISA